MKYLRPRPTAAAAALALALATGPAPARAQAPIVTRSLESAPADIIFRHSGRQAAEPWGEFFGEELATGDFNGDGKTDVAVSATNDSNPGDTSARRGRVYVFFGRGAQFPALNDPAEAVADCVLAGTEPFSWFGSELAAGDFDGDGLDDLAVAEKDLHNVYIGRVYVISGARIRASRAATVGAGEYDAVIRGRTSGPDGGYEQYFGFSLAAGDFNHDGIADLAAGAFAGDGVYATLRDAGEVAVFLGRSGGWPREVTADPTTADVYIGGRFANHLFGNELAAGDVDGDGRDELLVGGWGARGPNNDRSAAGDVSVYGFGPGSPLALPAAAPTAPLARVWNQGPLGLIHGPTVNSRIGASASTEGGRGVVVADYDGDGFGDVVIGAPFFGNAAYNGHNVGAVFVVYGGPALTRGAVLDLAQPGSGPGATSALLGTGESGSSLGDSVFAADLNGDGRAEVVAGAPDYGNTGNPREGFGTGSVSVFGGRSRTRNVVPPLTPLLPEPDVVVRGYTLPWRAGEDVAFIDASFAGRALLLVGLPEGGRSPQGGGRGSAGEVAMLDSAALAAAVPRQPFVSGLPASATVRPGASLELPLAAGGGTGSIASVEVVDSPAFAHVAGAGSSARLVLSPAPTDRGVFDVTVLATDSAGATGSRALRVAVGFTPAITSARAKAAGAGFKVTVSGGGFSKGDAVVEVDGVAVGGVKFSPKHEADGGLTVTRMTFKAPRVAAGSTVVVRNPREGLVSNAVVIQR